MSALDDARKKLEDEFNQVRKHLGKIRDALEQVEQAGPEDDIYGLLKALEKTVDDVRDGGILGSGAKGHRKALEKYQEVKATG